jgi:hypothetical protein
MVEASGLRLRAAAKLKLRQRQQAQTLNVAPDLSRWINDCITIEEPQGDTVTIIPFHLWDAQREALTTIQHAPQVIILKARQLGISWLVIAYALWLCLFHSNKNVMVFSKDQSSANEMVRRARGMYQRLARKPAGMITDNVTTIGWSNGSRIMSFAATEDAGSSFTASLIVLDEFAKMHYAADLYTSVKPTISDGGRIIIISTAKGEGNPFHKLWTSAQAGLNSLMPIFLPWHSRPTRTVEWYAEEERNAISPTHHKQEYPAVPDEAFQSIGEDRFLPSMALWDACLDASLPALTEHEQLIVALDGADVADSFGLIGVTSHPTRPGVLAVRVVYEWMPPRTGGIIDHYGDESNPGPDWIIRNVLAPRYALTEVVYDPHGLYQLTSGLMRDGIVACVEFPQSTQRLEADKHLFDLIASRRIVHDGNAALRKHIDNADRKLDPESRKLRIVKREAQNKIDLAVCLSMAAFTANQLGL